MLVCVWAQYSVSTFKYMRITIFFQMPNKCANIRSIHANTYWLEHVSTHIPFMVYCHRYWIDVKRHSMFFSFVSIHFGVILIFLRFWTFFFAWSHYNQSYFRKRGEKNILFSHLFYENVCSLEINSTFVTHTH